VLALRNSTDALGFLGRDDSKRIHQSTLNVLERTGVKVDEENALKLLKDAGAAVDFRQKTAKIPPSLIEEMIKKARKRVTLCGRNPKYDVTLEQGKVHVMTSSTGIRVLDLETGLARASTRKDIEDSARLADALENLHLYSVMVSALDCPQEIMHLEEVDAMLNNTEKHIDTGGLGTIATRDIIRMAATVVGGLDELRKRPILDLMQTPVSPLTHERKNTEGILECSKHEIPLIVLNMAQAGGTAPITLAGTLVINNAEVLSGMLIAFLANPDVPLVYGTCSIVLNQKASRTPSISGLVENGLLSAASSRLAGYYGFPCVVGADFGHWSEVDSRELGLFGALSAFLPALAGADVLYGVGLIDEAKTLSYEEMIVGNEVAGMMFRAVDGVRVSAETLAEEIIDKAGPGGNFLFEKHTLGNLRKELFIPDLIDRPKLEDVRRGARDKADRVISTHSPEPLSKGVKEELRKIIKEAYRRETGT
jgi:trimethylamine:corrinoid methyltransferase-like protein